MGRNPGHDRDQVLGLAMRAFWQHGYPSTSIDILVEATGLQRSGLYRTFGSKAGLFREAVERYSSVRAATIDLDAAPLAQLEQWFADGIRGQIIDDAPPGCLVIQSASDLSSLEPDLRPLVQAHLWMVERWFRTQVAQIDPTLDAERTAAVLAGANVAIHTLRRAGTPEATLIAIADAALGPLRR
jgi:TetR/AcrR family transcriptional regulator, transcriptional repressor for nem operon